MVIVMITSFISLIENNFLDPYGRRKVWTFLIGRLKSLHSIEKWGMHDSQSEVVL